MYILTEHTVRVHIVDKLTCNITMKRLDLDYPSLIRLNKWLPGRMQICNSSTLSSSTL